MHRFVPIIAAMAFICVFIPSAMAGTPIGTVVKATQVSPSVVAAAATQPGANVEGVSALRPTTSVVNTATSSPYVCFDSGYPPNDPLWDFWSQWPTQQRLWEHRYWCGYLNDYQTYRVSSVYAGSDYACSPGDPTYQYKTAGGNGSFYTDVLSSKHFQCAVWGSFQDYMVWRCNMAGYCTLRADGRL